ncbi:hypothetical protein [Helicobacter felistomachi]|uniref:hypothetical protein n=1 Tax=Helicobacter felistomachi TaxID=3040201 RepID=UPI002572B34C|nr:hypothetical protein [Helicobacter sp. NHP21005]
MLEAFRDAPTPLSENKKLKDKISQQKLTVICGNPPFSANQKDANDNNTELPYAICKCLLIPKQTLLMGNPWKKKKPIVLRICWSRIHKHRLPNSQTPHKQPKPKPHTHIVDLYQFLRQKPAKLLFLQYVKMALSSYGVRSCSLSIQRVLLPSKSMAMTSITFLRFGLGFGFPGRFCEIMDSVSSSCSFLETWCYK